MTAITPLGSTQAQKIFVNLKLKGAWCYSGQDVGVIKPRNVGVTATPSPVRLPQSVTKT